MEQAWSKGLRSDGVKRAFLAETACLSGLWSCDNQAHISAGRKGLSSDTVWEAAGLKEMEGDADSDAGRKRSGEGLGETGVDRAESRASPQRCSGNETAPLKNG